MPQWTLFENDFRAIDQVLIELLEKTNALSAHLVDRSGQLITTSGRSADFDVTAFASLVKDRAEALIVAADVSSPSRRERLVALAARHALPTIYPARQYAVAGGLISYGNSDADSSHQIGIYVGRILGGAKPAELPVVRATRFELVINLKTAKALGLTVPQALLARADEVIE